VIGTSIIFEPVWNRIKSYLHIVECAPDGGHENPRIRIEFLDVPEMLARDLVMVTMRCVNCQRPIHPLRHREGDDWDRIYYACTCLITVRMACSRGRAAELEYERFKGLKLGDRQSSQLALF
jgi:hypothetical protein